MSVQGGTPVGVVLKQLLNTMMNMRPEVWLLSITTLEPVYFDDVSEVDDTNGKAVFDWSQISQGDYLRAIWTRIWQCLYKINQ